MKLWSRLAISTITFVVVGPLVGAIALLLKAVLDVSPSSAQQVSETVLSSIALFVIGLIPAYLIGAIPAAIAGALFGLIQLKYRPAYAPASAIGLLIGYLVTSILVMHFWSEWSFIGAASGAVSGSIAAIAISLVGPNNSFKPKPLRGSA